LIDFGHKRPSHASEIASLAGCFNAGNEALVKPLIPLGIIADVRFPKNSPSTDGITTDSHHHSTTGYITRTKAPVSSY
jgi:hypothetical protein